MPPWSIGYHPNEFNLIYSQFEQYFICMPPWSIGYNPNEFTPIFSNISCPVEFDRARNTAQNGSKFTGITFVCLPGQLGIIPMNLLPFLAIFHARSNWTGQEILLKMGVNSLELHLYASLIELGIIPMNLLPF